MVVVLGIGAVLVADLGLKGVQLVGDVPAGLPSFVVPWMDSTIVFGLLPHALVIAVVAFMEAFSINSTTTRPNRTRTIERVDCARRGQYRSWSLSRILL